MVHILRKAAEYPRLSVILLLIPPLFGYIDDHNRKALAFRKASRLYQYAAVVRTEIGVCMVGLHNMACSEQIVASVPDIK